MRQDAHSNEHLVKIMGLYFNAGGKDLGSGDISFIMEMINVRSDFYETANMQQNTERIRNLFFILLYSRLLILEHCLSITGSNKTFTCQRWMLLQVATPVFKDVFLDLFKPISVYVQENLLSSAIMWSVQEQFKKVSELLSSRSDVTQVHSKFVIVLDESQNFGRRLPEVFLGTNNEIRPVLAPILTSIRHISTSKKDICVMPCGTGLSSYELDWAGGSASDMKLSVGELIQDGASKKVVDFEGWTDIKSISTYLERLGESLNEEARNRLHSLIPQEAVAMLHCLLRGRFRPIISAIEDILEVDDPVAWRDCIVQFEERLTTADILTYGGGERSLEGNLCIELHRVFQRVRKLTSPAEKRKADDEISNVKATLKFAVVAYITQGGYRTFRGVLPELVESAFGRIKTFDGVSRTIIDEPFAIKAADNYFQATDPEYLQHRMTV
ncbi:hypothetical protein EMPS_07356 [Entomortierella parvispora]|uniref:Uncharacterized protein n=1 Tax=Entomortierella parvispora TaxID=205924 RepID=A0A9P3HEE8_9FUNG|nr:hypothetical protein EMPS_07356 [Entomortierella parvispora]